MSDHRITGDQVEGLLYDPARYLGSCPPPPDRPGEYVVSWRRAWWPAERPTARKPFHDPNRARAFRDRLEAEHGAGTAVRIDHRPTGAWREIP